MWQTWRIPHCKVQSFRIWRMATMLQVSERVHSRSKVRRLNRSAIGTPIHETLVVTYFTGSGRSSSVLNNCPGATIQYYAVWGPAKAKYGPEKTSYYIPNLPLQPFVCLALFIMVVAGRFASNSFDKTVALSLVDLLAIALTRQLRDLTNRKHTTGCRW
ncbi:hypothetical protein J6590_014025 [Homalodisca vitripennis]|nr:hypothetical protein J6590_014025 [Homalodisca vitripennis]